MEYSDSQLRELHLAALASLLLEQQQEEFDRGRRTENKLSDAEKREMADKVRGATSSTYTWLTRYTKTFNPHWKDHGWESPYRAFPSWPFVYPLCEYLEDDSERVKLIEKSRDMMATWTIAGYFTLQCQLVAEREVIVQTMTDEKGFEVISYAKHLYASQPQWLRDAFPLPKPLDKQPASEFRVGTSVMHVIPSGIGKIRSYHPWGIFSDETAFQPEAEVAYDEARASGVRKIVLNSTANAGWYYDFTHDATMARA
jgi:hypothetical protein